MPGTDVPLLVASGAWMVLAFLADFAGDVDVTYKSYLLEDGAKLLGIVHWTGYVVHTARGGLLDVWRKGVGEA